MTTTKWVQSGANWLWATWVGDTQVIYLLDDTKSPLTGEKEWLIRRSVVGAAKDKNVIGIQGKLDKAQKIAEYDADDLQKKGF